MKPHLGFRNQNIYYGPELSTLWRTLIRNWTYVCTNIDRRTCDCAKPNFAGDTNLTTHWMRVTTAQRQAPYKWISIQATLRNVPQPLETCLTFPLSISWLFLKKYSADPQIESSTFRRNLLRSFLFQIKLRNKILYVHRFMQSYM